MTHLLLKTPTIVLVDPAKKLRVAVLSSKVRSYAPTPRPGVNRLINILINRYTDFMEINKLGLSYNNHIWAKLPKYLCSETCYQYSCSHRPSIEDLKLF